jgi:hypothetical protein
MIGALNNPLYRQRSISAMKYYQQQYRSEETFVKLKNVINAHVQDFA